MGLWRFSLPCPAAYIGRGLSFHSTATFSLDVFLRAGGRPRGAEKQEMQTCPCPPTVFLLGL